MASLWASRADLEKLRQASAAVLLVGGYDGSGNYGDVLQVATAIEAVGRLPGGPLPVAIVEHEIRAHHQTLVAHFSAQLGGTIFLYFKNDDDDPAEDLVELHPPAVPGRAAVYVYGGGFLNHRWGGRKVEHVAAAERLSRRRPLPLVASGLQVDEAAVAPGGVAHELLARAGTICARDRRSLGYLRAHLPTAAAASAELAGDDAVPFLRPAVAEVEPVVNLHLNDGVWVSEDPDAMAGRIARLLGAAAAAAAMPLRLQPVIAYEDPRVSERRAVAALLGGFGRELEAAGYAIDDPIDLLDDAIEGRLAGFRRARLTVACSYHVSLTSLLSGIPTVLFAENEYYEQKAAGLRDLFGLAGDSLLGTQGGRGEGEAAAWRLVDGETRSQALAHLRESGARVVERWERGRATVEQALATALSGSRLRRTLNRLRSG